MKRITVNGEEIPESAIAFELARLTRFYLEHGISEDEIKKSASLLRDRAIDQAIGAKLLLARTAELDIRVTEADIDAEVAKVVAQLGGEENYRKALAAQNLDESTFRRELEKGAKVNKLVEQACSEIPDPSEDEIAEFFAAHRADFGEKTLVDVHDQIRGLLRHQARGRALDAFVAELKASAKIER